MFSFNKNIIALAVLATTAMPVLAESIDVRVTGTISPAACTPLLTGGGTIDYGAIKPSSLADDAYTTLAEKQLDFAINCSAPAKIAIKAVSQRGASTVNQKTGDLAELTLGNTLFGADNAGAAGLGLDGDKGIGGYSIRLAAGTMQADGTDVDSIQSNGNTSDWAKTEYGILFNTVANQRYASWATPGTTAPVAFTTLTGKLGVQAYINKASELDLTRPVALDGLATLELVYL